jgi:hypothetical protein
MQTTLLRRQGQDLVDAVHIFLALWRQTKPMLGQSHGLLTATIVMSQARSTSGLQPLAGGVAS